MEIKKFAEHMATIDLAIRTYEIVIELMLSECSNAQEHNPQLAQSLKDVKEKCSLATQKMFELYIEKKEN